jgi:transposase, IS5 family
MRAGFPANSAMQSKPDSVAQAQFLVPDLTAMLDARQPLYRLAQTIDWTQFAIAFGPLYAEEGRPALPIRRLVELLLRKQLHNLSDERVVEQWTLNPYLSVLLRRARVSVGRSMRAE